MATNIYHYELNKSDQLTKPTIGGTLILFHCSIQVTTSVIIELTKIVLIHYFLQGGWPTQGSWSPFWYSSQLQLHPLTSILHPSFRQPQPIHYSKTHAAPCARELSSSQMQLWTSSNLFSAFFVQVPSFNALKLLLWNSLLLWIRTDPPHQLPTVQYTPYLHYASSHRAFMDLWLKSNLALSYAFTLSRRMHEGSCKRPSLFIVLKP